ENAAAAAVLGHAEDAYDNCTAGTIKRQYYACRWQVGDTLDFYFDVDYSGKGLGLAANQPFDGSDASFDPVYKSQADATLANTTGKIRVGVTVTHVDTCGDTTTGFDTEVGAGVGI
ncbi:uncharacterized protein METZ01_LOCUS343079, partial [marine metagenome]